MMVVATILFLIFLLLASMHIYWSLGGRGGREAVMPSKDVGASLFTPAPLPTLIVAAALLLAGFIILASGGLIAFALPVFADRYALWSLLQYS